MQTKSFEEIRESMRNYIIAHQDRLTDFNDGSVLESLVEAAAREVAMLYVRCRVGFSSFLRALPYSVFGFEKKPGQRASTTVIFSRAKAVSYETAIPEGTIISAGGLKFLTTEAGGILSGGTKSGEIPAVAEGVGEDYNIEAGAVKTVVSPLPSDVVSVGNPNPATGGAASESWQDYAARFAAYITGLQRTNEAGFIDALTRDYGVRSLLMEEHFPPLDDIWNMTVYLEDGSGGISASEIDRIKKMIDGDGSAANGGYRAPGINIRYLPPEKVFVDLVINITTTQDVTNEIDKSVIISEAQKTTKEFIDGLKIGESFILSDLIVVLRGIYYFDDVKIESPEENVLVRKYQIARYRDCTVNVALG